MRYICAFHDLYFGMYDLLWHSFKYIDYPNFRYDTQWAFEKEIHCVLQYSQHVMSSFGLWSVFNCVLLFQGYSLKVKLNDCCYYFYTGMSSHNLLLLWYTPYIQTYYHKKSWVINRNNKYKSIINNNNEYGLSMNVMLENISTIVISF